MVKSNLELSQTGTHSHCRVFFLYYRKAKVTMNLIFMKQKLNPILTTIKALRMLKGAFKLVLQLAQIQVKNIFFIIFISPCFMSTAMRLKFFLP